MDDAHAPQPPFRRLDRMIRAGGRWLVEPHPSILSAEDRHGARLFASLLLVHMALVGFFFGAIWVITWHYLHHDIREDADTPIIMGGTALLVAPYLLLRA